MSVDKKKDWIDWVSHALKPIPIVGPLVAGIVIMAVGLVYMVAFVAFIGLILIPFQADNETFRNLERELFDASGSSQT